MLRISFSRFASSWFVRGRRHNKVVVKGCVVIIYKNLFELIFLFLCGWRVENSSTPHIRIQNYVRTATTSVTLLVREYLNHNTPLQYDCTTKVILLHILGQIPETMHLENLLRVSCSSFASSLFVRGSRHNKVVVKGCVVIIYKNL